jgi:hypothetical protein
MPFLMVGEVVPAAPESLEKLGFCLIINVQASHQINYIRVPGVKPRYCISIKYPQMV